MLTPRFLCRAGLVQIIETAMNKTSQQSQPSCSLVQPDRRPEHRANLVPVEMGLGGCDLKQPSKMIVIGRFLVQLAVLGVALVATIQLLGIADRMTTGRVTLSLQLLQLLEMQVDIDKQPIEDPQSP
jgi:hypothetical protein